MQGPGSLSIMLVVGLATTACTSSSLPTLPSSQSPPQTGSADIAQAPPAEVVAVVPGSPTDVYALVARGALMCWFGAEGFLKPTYVFHAEAEPPAKGGAAEMVLHERDETLRDKRGARAFRVSFTGLPEGTRVAIATPRMEQQLGSLMARDVTVWAKGGSDCGLRRHNSPQALTPVVGKPDAAANKRR